MWKTVLLCLFSVYYSDAKLEDEIRSIYDAKTCGTASPAVQRFIRGGAGVKPNELPWSVKILFPKSFCSGTLITRKHVLTAAHCWDEKPSKSELDKTTTVQMIGMCGTKPCKSMLERKVKKMFFYEKFDPEQKRMNDIVLLELDKLLPVGVHHACLPTDKAILDLRKDDIYTSGVGERFNGDKSGILMKVLLGKRDAFQLPDVMKLGVFEVMGEGNKAICTGDSGGGATSIVNGRHVLVGVTSLGDCEARPQFATNIFTDVVQRMPEIEAALKLGKV